MEPFANPIDPRDARQPPRCLSCYYRLEGLDAPRCPECGRVFDPSDPSTFTRRPPFVFWTYWLPAVALALACGFVSMLVIALSGSIGWTATIGVPIVMGAILGYGVRLDSFGGVVAIGGVVLLSFAIGLITLHPAAVFCIAILSVLFAVPLSVGIFTGMALRAILKRTRFSQRSHLPMLMLAILPLIAGECERRWAPVAAVETVTTDAELPVSPERAWDSLMFYEEVRHEPPLLLRLGLPRPVRTTGDANRPGDVTTCHYVHGHLRKLVTRAEPGRSLEFDVIDQFHVEDHAIRLVDGSFRFEPVAPERTRVVLTTRYEPLLTPRFGWRPVERLVVHTLHRHVLEGMRRSVEPPAPVALHEEAR